MSLVLKLCRALGTPTVRNLFYCAIFVEINQGCYYYCSQVGMDFLTNVTTPSTDRSSVIFFWAWIDLLTAFAACSALNMSSSSARCFSQVDEQQMQSSIKTRPLF